MPYNIVYEDPELLGQATRDAYGMAQRRSNIDKSLDRQLQADEANARLGLGYEQLYQGIAQRDQDRAAQMQSDYAQREAQAAYQQRSIDAGSYENEAQRAGQMQLLDRRAEIDREQMKLQLDEPRRREFEIAEANLRALDKHVADNGLDPNTPWVDKARQKITNMRDGIIFSAPPKAPAPDMVQQAIDEGRAKDLGGGSLLVQQPDGEWERIDPPPPAKAPEPPKPITPIDLVPAMKTALDALTKEDPASGTKTLPKPDDVAEYILSLQGVADKLNARNVTSGDTAPTTPAQPAAQAPAANIPKWQAQQQELDALIEKYGATDPNDFPPEDRQRYFELIQPLKARNSALTSMKEIASQYPSGEIPPEVRKKVLEYLKVLKDG